LTAAAPEALNPDGFFNTLERMRSFVSQRAVGTYFLVTLVTWATSVAQASPQDSFSPVPHASEAADLDELDGDGADSDPSSLANERLSAELAAQSPYDLRAKHSNAVSLGVGRVKPWQAVSLELGTLVRPDLLCGLYAGGGSFNLYGNKIGGRSYDMTMQSRGAGALARYYFQKFRIFAVEATAGLATWNGHIAPRGSDDSIAVQQEKLTDSFHAIGFTAGVAGNLTWVWGSGVFIDWTVAGIQFAKVVKKDFSRDDGAVNRVVTHDIEALRIYGIVDLKVGYYF